MCLTKGNLTSCRSETHYSFFKHTSSLLILYPFYFCLQRQTSSVVRMLWDYRKHAQACKQARTSCLSCCILFGGMGGQTLRNKSWTALNPKYYVPAVCSESYTSFQKKTAYSLSDMKTKMKERVRERKKEEKTLVMWRGIEGHRAAVMLVQKAREGNEKKHIEGGRGWKRMRDACTVI